MNTNRQAEPEFGAAYASKQLARKGSMLRRWVKSFYVARVLSVVRGPTLDVGCGAGQILERLPPGSAGIELNPVLVEQHQARGLDVRQAQPDAARIDLSPAAPGAFRTLVLSHVLEHFVDAHRVLGQLLADAGARGIERVVIVVPGRVGYDSDATHKTFVTRAYLAEHGVEAGAGFALAQASYFPGDAAWLGRWYVYHELMLVYDRRVA
jgi:SAM-dependent methyltransferase